ncbi:MAG: hypothetical protein ABIG43_04850 [Chloroflexota bacterium]
MSYKKAVPPVKRNLPAEGPAKIQSMAQRKSPSPWKIFLYVTLLAVFLLVILWVLGLNQFGPFVKVTPTPTSVVSLTPSPTITHTNTSTPTIRSSATLTATPTFTPTATEKPMPFVLKGSPEPLSNDLLHPELDCEALIIGGQVWDLQDAPMIGLTVHLGGHLGQYEVDFYTLTGSADIYGESGYEFIILEIPRLVSEDTLWIQLEDPSGLPLSSRNYLKTSESCQENLILVNYKQVR